MTTNIDTSAIGSASFLDKVALGLVPGWEIISKFGAIHGLTGPPQPINVDGIYQTPISAEELEVVSTSDQDKDGGTGAYSVQVKGLDENWNKKEQVFLLNGLTPVPIGAWTRVHSTRIAASESYATLTTPSHIGDITVRGVGAGATWITIDSTSFMGGLAVGTSLCGVYSTPAGSTCWLLGKKITKESNKLPTISLYVRTNADTVTPPYSSMFLSEIDIGIDAGVSYQPREPMGPFAGSCDIGFIGYIATGTASIEVDFQLLVKL